MAREVDASASPDVPSPCVRNCCLDEADVCLGCGRTIDEILRWQKATNAEREAIVRKAAERRALRPSW